MTARILALTQRPVDTTDGHVRTIDVYDLAAVELAHYTGILVEGGCDQRFLATQQPQLDHRVESGGRVVANGHPIQRWLAKMPAHRALDFHTPEDLWLYPVGEHPI